MLLLLLQVSAIIPAAQVNCLLLPGGKSDNTIKQIFKDVYKVYLRVMLNPFFPGVRITSAAVTQRIAPEHSQNAILVGCQGQNKGCKSVTLPAGWPVVWLAGSDCVAGGPLRHKTRQDKTRSLHHSSQPG